MSFLRITLSRSGIRDRLAGPPRPAGRHLFLDPADPVEHVVDAAAGDLLHHRLQGLALAERVEHRRDRADLQRVRPEEHQVVEHPVELGQRHPQPDRPLRHLDAHQPFDGEHHPELVGERGQPVVPVGQHDDLPVVAHLEQLLGPAVHVADDRLAGHHPFAVEGQLEAQHTVGGRVLGPDVEHHVGGVEPGAGPHGHLTRHASMLPRASIPTVCSNHQ
jgi:hypothetical protein